jgi:hypothetical protein
MAMAEGSVEFLEADLWAAAPAARKRVLAKAGLSFVAVGRLWNQRGCAIGICLLPRPAGDG